MSLTALEVHELSSRFEKIRRKYASEIPEEAVDELADLWCDLETRAESESERRLRSEIAIFLFDVIVEQCPKTDDL